MAAISQIIPKFPTRLVQPGSLLVPVKRTEPHKVHIAQENTWMCKVRA